MCSLHEHGEWLADLLITVEMLQFYELGDQIEKISNLADFTKIKSKLAELLQTEKAEKYLN